MAVVVLGFGVGCGTAESTEPAAVAGKPIAKTVTTQPPTAQPATAQPATAQPATTPTPAVTTTVKPKLVVPKTTTKSVVELKVIPFKKKTVTDSALPKGERTIRTPGVNGSRKLTYDVTYVDGKQTTKKLVRQEVAKEPRTQVTAVGTKVEAEETGGGCDPNYSGCVPIASDVDCSGGSGNGPEYVDGPVTVTGSDIYRLDADHDGIGCE
ncbi:G5 domain-containing protein [Kribbella sp. NBC_01505]|uniref:G5 domain-containing protein n=1 Tax=Kribbella sp. NBC_01505 TaxID=2903580 RepID=UPI00386CB147